MGNLLFCAAWDCPEIKGPGQVNGKIFFYIFMIIEFIYTKGAKNGYMF